MLHGSGGNRTKHSWRRAYIVALRSEETVRRDLDLLGRGDPSVERLAAVFRDVCGAAVEDDGLAFELVEALAPPVSLRSGLIGDYNVSNLLAVIATLRAQGITLPDAARACEGLTAAPGRMQRVAGEQGGGFVEGLVARGPAAAQVRVVHARQVVMDQRISVDALDGAGGGKGRFGIPAAGLAGGEEQDRTQAFPPGKHAVPDGRMQGRRWGRRGREQALQGGIDAGGLRGEVGRKFRHGKRGSKSETEKTGSSSGVKCGGRKWKIRDNSPAIQQAQPKRDCIYSQRQGM